jgi:hypothetical protein
MTVQTIKLGGRKFLIILPEKDFQRMNMKLAEMAAQDRADSRLARRRLRDPKEKPISYQRARKELALA